MRFVVLAVFFVAVGIPALQAGAQEASLAITPDSGPCDTPVSVTGSGFPPDVEMIVIATRGGDHGIDGMPTAHSDSSGGFTTIVSFRSDDCLSPAGVVIFACPAEPPICEPKVRVPFTLVTGDLPIAGTGGLEKRAPPYWLLALSLAGAAALVAGLALRANRDGWTT